MSGTCRFVPFAAISLGICRTGSAATPCCWSAWPWRLSPAVRCGRCWAREALLMRWSTSAWHWGRRVWSMHRWARCCQSVSTSSTVPPRLDSIQPGGHSRRVAETLCGSAPARIQWACSGRTLYQRFGGCEICGLAAPAPGSHRRRGTQRQQTLAECETGSAERFAWLAVTK